MISLNSEGEYLIERKKTTSTGSYGKHVPLCYKGNPIKKTNVRDLIIALRLDGSFMLDAARYEKNFISECEGCEGTDAFGRTEFIRGKMSRGKKAGSDAEKTTEGGIGSKRDINAVTMIVRYFKSPKHSDDITVMMIQSLEALCRELAASKFESDDQKGINSKCFELCKRIYDASALRGKDIELLKHWFDESSED